MQHFIIDTSVIVWAFIEDSQTPRVRQLLEEAEKGKIVLIAPGLLWCEFYSVITRKYKDDITALKFIEAFELLISEDTIKIIEDRVTKQALKIAHTRADGQEGHIGPNDAYFHAVAVEYDSVFLTNDKKHYKKTIDSIGHIMLFEDLKLPA
ncbi:MAG: type II toxin-antitoxin system VapC family toxin [Bacteroidota bacterium]